MKDGSVMLHYLMLTVFNGSTLAIKIWVNFWARGAYDATQNVRVEEWEGRIAFGSSPSDFEEHSHVHGWEGQA